ncbi:MAG TPA: transglycosylase SLT domain-containing protein [Gemmatimonadales bacterium]|nr:transglycosylase SLT domain-containing protein [Gemmatimonadales bacterium]
MISLLALAFFSFHPAQGQTPQVPDSSLVSDAAGALASGRPYLASRTLAPLLASAAPRDPAITLLAARAAAGWDSWGNVVRLLAGEPWLDQLEGGAGRALLARARVERSEEAVRDAEASVANAPAGERGPRLVVLARSYDRAGILDSAALTYRRAAALLPTIEDWLLLRAAGVERDSLRRDSLLARIGLPAARPRIRWTEAVARDRSGDPAGAAELYDELGAALTSLRLRLKATSDPDSLKEIRRALLGLLSPRRSADESRGAIALLDANFAPLTLAEERTLARRAAAVDRAARAAAGFARAVKSAPLSDADELTYAGVLARLGRHREALTAFTAIKARDLKARSEYGRARSLLALGRSDDALELLRQVSVKYAADTATAALAGYLAAELLVDRRDDVSARKEFLALSRRFPRTSYGSRAGFQAALIALIQGAPGTAAAEFEALAKRPGDQSETAASLYWAGRALAASGDSGAALLKWREVWERFPASYYVLPAATRLGLPAELPPRAEEPPARSDSVAKVLDRGALLESVGLDFEARLEYDRLAREATTSGAMLGEVAAAFAERGFTARAYRLAQRSGDPRMQRLTYPIPWPADLYALAGAAGVDPLLAAAIIRQESGYEPTARSRADAMGLMQVLPSVGAALARVEGIREWESALLYQPEINLRFGISHLAQTLRRYTRLEHALATYNAGARPTADWLGFPGAADDPEVFIERIQYVETRDYVRRVLRNLSVYRALYEVRGER